MTCILGLRDLIIFRLAINHFHIIGWLFYLHHHIGLDISPNVAVKFIAGAKLYINNSRQQSIKLVFIVNAI